MNRSDHRDLLDPREKLGHKARQVPRVIRAKPARQDRLVKPGHKARLVLTAST